MLSGRVQEFRALKGILIAVLSLVKEGARLGENSIHLFRSLKPHNTITPRGQDIGINILVFIQDKYGLTAGINTITELLFATKRILIPSLKPSLGYSYTLRIPLLFVWIKGG